MGPLQTQPRSEQALLDKVAVIRATVPPEGLFAGKDWLTTPEPFRIDAPLAEELGKLGYRLLLFNRACNLLYRLSVEGKQPRWVAEYLDRGKPPELVELSRQRIFRDEIPGVIRPDLVLTERGYTIAELDSVPGGIGLTHWLNTTYAPLGGDILGGADGMLEGFQAMLGGDADLVISDEAETYRPEMHYLARLSSGALRVHDAASFQPDRPRAHDLSLFRKLRSRECPGGRRDHECSCHWRSAGHAALQTLPRGEALVRAVLDAAVARVLAARAE